MVLAGGDGSVRVEGDVRLAAAGAVAHHRVPWRLVPLPGWFCGQFQRSGNVGTAGICTLRREVALFPPYLTTIFRWSAAALVSAAAVLRRSVATPVTGRPTDIRFRQVRSAGCKIFQIFTVR